MRHRIAIVSGCAVFLICLIHAIKNPMLVHFSDGPLGALAIPSPFRDRRPEEVALVFLKEIGSDGCHSALERLGLAKETCESMCAKERQLRPDRYRLQSIVESANEVQLVFRWSISNSVDQSGVCVLKLGRDREYDWQVQGYDREY